MRWTMLLLFSLAPLCHAPVASAQRKEKFIPPEIKKIHIGFQTFQDDERTTYKVGLWTPIYVQLSGGTDGIKAKDNSVPYVEIETNDSEDVATKIKFHVDVEPEKERTFIGYLKTGHMGQNFSEVKVTLVDAQGHKFTPRSQELSRSLDIDRHLYLVIGSKMLELNRAIKLMNKPAPDDKDFLPNDRWDSNFRQLVFETHADRLPDMWFGYNGLDLMVLATEDNRPFLTTLNGHPAKLKAIAQWVRRGGRLIVPISPQQQDVVAELLQSSAWQPPIPVTPPRAGEDLRFPKLPGLHSWGGDTLQNNDSPIPVATLDPGKVPPGDWKVLLESSDARDARPMVTQVRYGLGQITYLALSLADRDFNNWAAREKFLQTLIGQTVPKAPARVEDFDRRFGGRDVPKDVTTELVSKLDEFDVTVIPFGYVALFIILYILVVGPLDFVLLKYVFKRLEWTWITFPSVVLAVSVIAYFAAYTLKGRDLKINKVDIVDFDLRTHLDKQTRQPASFRAYGQSFFTILSPRIQNYTIGLEPNPLFWGGEVKKVKKEGKDVDEVLSADLLSWLGRPSGGMHDMGRGGSGGFFRNAYEFTEDASALQGVPIPVWTTKTFTASWEHKLGNPPFVADLFYHQNPAKDMKITGELANHLGVDLTDVWLIYAKRFYRIEGGLKSVKRGGQTRKLEISGLVAPDATEWVRHVDAKETGARAWAADPTELVKQILFTEAVDPQGIVRNHLLRPLDQSWRLQEEPRDSDRPTREAILFGRVKYVNGSADALMRDAKAPLPTKLWIGDTPETGKAWPDAPGNMNQDTYIRVSLALRPGDE
jgi:hypothetical protein